MQWLSTSAENLSAIFTTQRVVRGRAPRCTCTWLQFLQAFLATRCSELDKCNLLNMRSASEPVTGTVIRIRYSFRSSDRLDGHASACCCKVTALVHAGIRRATEQRQTIAAAELTYSNCRADVPEYTEYAILFLLDRQPHGVKCQNLYGSEVTWTIKQLEVEGSHLPQCQC